MVEASPPPDTVAVLVTRIGALPATLTVKVMTGYVPPGPSGLALVQVSVPRLQLQPAPVMAVAVSDGGSVSTTVTVPVVDAGPLLTTGSEGMPFVTTTRSLGPDSMAAGASNCVVTISLLPTGSTPILLWS